MAFKFYSLHANPDLLPLNVSYTQFTVLGCLTVLLRLGLAVITIRCWRDYGRGLKEIVFDRKNQNDFSTLAKQRQQQQQQQHEGAGPAALHAATAIAAGSLHTGGAGAMAAASRPLLSEQYHEDVGGLDLERHSHSLNGAGR